LVTDKKKQKKQKKNKKKQKKTKLCVVGFVAQSSVRYHGHAGWLSVVTQATTEGASGP